MTLVHVPGSVTPGIETHRPRPSFLQHLPQARTRYRQYLPLFPAAVEQFDLDEVELVISTSHCAAKAVVPTGRARHLCYCFTPMRYAWDQFDAYFGTGAGRRAEEPAVRTRARAPGPLGCGDRGPRRSLCRHLAVRGQPDRPIL